MLYAPQNNRGLHRVDCYRPRTKTNILSLQQKRNKLSDRFSWLTQTDIVNIDRSGSAGRRPAFGTHPDCDLIHIGQIDPLILPELPGEVLDDTLVQVVTAQVGIAARRLHLEDALTQLQDGDVVGSATQVEDGDLFFRLFDTDPRPPSVFLPP